MKFIRHDKYGWFSFHWKMGECPSSCQHILNVNFGLPRKFIFQMFGVGYSDGRSPHWTLFGIEYDRDWPFLKFELFGCQFEKVYRTAPPEGMVIVKSTSFHKIPDLKEATNG